MPALRSLLLFLGLSLLSIGFARSQSDESGFDTAAVAADWEETLKALPGESLRAALENHLKPKYRNGVFEDGLSAMAAVRSDDPELASRLVDLAKHDAEVKDYLRKRQSNNSTTASSPSPSSTAPTVVGSSSSSAESSGPTPTPIPIPSPTPTEPSSSGQSSPTSDRSSPGASPTPTPSSASTSIAIEPSSTPGEEPSSSVIESSVVITEDGSTSTSVTSVVVVFTPSSSVSPSNNEPASSSPSSSSVVSSSRNQGSQSVPVPPSPTSDTSIATGVLVPVQISTTVDGSTLVETSQAFQPSAPTSVAVPVTSVNDQGSTVVFTSTAPAAIISVTDSRGSVVATAIPITSVDVAPGGSIVQSATVTTTDAAGDNVVLTSPTAGGVYTVTNAQGAVVTVTYQPMGGTVNQVALQTTTLPNGQQSVITSFTQVGGPNAAANTEGAATASSTNTPGLQSGATLPSSWYAAEIAMVVGAAIGVAGLVL